MDSPGSFLVLGFFFISAWFLSEISVSKHYCYSRAGELQVPTEQTEYFVFFSCISLHQPNPQGLLAAVK